MWPRLIASVVLVSLSCSPAPPRIHVDLAKGPTMLRQTPSVFSADEPLPADNDSVGLCIYPSSGYKLTERWTVLTPQGDEARIVAHAELTDGSFVTLSSPSSTGDNVCVHPRVDGPLAGPVRQVRVVSSTPVIVDRIVWTSTAP